MAFSFPIRVYWEDTDAGGIVFYANYLKFFERARTEWLRHLGVAQQQLRDEVGGMFVVTQAELNYLQPARLDDMLSVTAVLQSAGRASITIAQQAFLQPVSSDRAPQLLCEGSIRIGWVDAQTMRPARIPNSIVEKLS
ncbi:MAG: tol-pal system-associated acyl-CoA thioesterase [Comamonas sp.]